MTPQEFKAWFEGFTEAFDRIPTKVQWARIKERVAEIDGKPVTERVFVDRYWPIVNQYPYRPSPHWQYYSVAGNAVGQALGTSSVAYRDALNLTTNNAQSFNSSAAMLDLGRADAKGLAS